MTLKQVESPSRAAARRALELDPLLPEVHVSIGRIKYGHDWDWAGAGKDFSRALELDPNNLDAHFFSAMLGMALGRFDDSIAHIEGRSSSTRSRRKSNRPLAEFSGAPTNFRRQSPI